jgi:hypothetical protein
MQSSRTVQFKAWNFLLKVTFFKKIFPDFCQHIDFFKVLRIFFGEAFCFLHKKLLTQYNLLLQNYFENSFKKINYVPI